MSVMNRKRFASKYSDVIRTIYQAGGQRDDTSVCVDKLISSIRGYFKETYTDGRGEHVFTIYPGIPDEFVWEEAYEDYKEMIKPLN